MAAFHAPIGGNGDPQPLRGLGLSLLSLDPARAQAITPPLQGLLFGQG